MFNQLCYKIFTSVCLGHLTFDAEASMSQNIDQQTRSERMQYPRRIKISILIYKRYNTCWGGCVFGRHRDCRKAVSFLTDSSAVVFIVCC
jgi:hypothetical protein